nr:glycogen debranching protein GlgX [Endozoicomonas sp. OPT23]
MESGARCAVFPCRCINSQFQANTVTSEFITSSGQPHLQGATLVNSLLESVSSDQATGVNFAVYAPAARQVWLCLFDSGGHEQTLPMEPSSQGVWHLYVEGLLAGQSYGFRADGEWQEHASPSFNKHKLLLDPYSREVKGSLNWSSSLFDYKKDCDGQVVFNDEDSAVDMPRSVVRETTFDWQSVRRPRTSRSDSFIYELHVKGFTRQHPEVPEELRGTYLGLCQPVVIDYFKKLGVTAVELLPVTSMVSEERLHNMGLSNYWGYNPLCMMAPEPSLAVKDPVTEFKTMVRELHRAGIEVLMDVVYNHTCETGIDGPSLSMRGLAENDYYLVEQHDGHLESVNYTGCGNTMNFDSPQTLKLTMDTLRVWAEEYQIDGFRFDLAPTMARQHRTYKQDSNFFRSIHQDPLLGSLKMIAEPWDIGPEGYQLAQFPQQWQEWSDRYRDSIRSFWRGDNGRLAEMGWRISGSEDVFGADRPMASINYICSHDGFTLNDLVSYNERHNLANGEENRDGDQHNFSCNYGVEGETDDRQMTGRRLRIRKNMLAMLMLSRGTPMLMAGDEFSNSQGGNNNAYCQDSSLSWLNWSWLSDENSDGTRLQTFLSELTEFRNTQSWLKGDGGRTGIDWFDPDGGALTERSLGELAGGCLCIRLTTEADRRSLYILLNNTGNTRKFHVPAADSHKFWSRQLDTSLDQPFTSQPLLTRGWYEVSENSLVVIEESS